MNFKIIKNPNDTEYKEITQKVIDNNGYCPCSIIKNEDTKCLCKEFRKQEEEGYCHCHRFKKVKTDEKS